MQYKLERVYILPQVHERLRDVRDRSIQPRDAAKTCWLADCWMCVDGITYMVEVVYKSGYVYRLALCTVQIPKLRCMHLVDPFARSKFTSSFACLLRSFECVVIMLTLGIYLCLLSSFDFCLLSFVPLARRFHRSFGSSS